MLKKQYIKTIFIHNHKSPTRYIHLSLTELLISFFKKIFNEEKYKSTRIMFLREKLIQMNQYKSNDRDNKLYFL